MTIKEKLQPAVQIQIGLVFLILASLTKYLLQTRLALADDWADGLTGLLYGVAIGFLLIGIWRKSRGKPD